MKIMISRSASSRSFTFGLAVASFALLGAAGCSKSADDQASDKMKDAYHDSKDAMGDAWQNVKSVSFDRKNDFQSEAKAKMAKFDSEMSDMKKNQEAAEATDSRKAAWAKIKDSESNYHQKVDALGNASSDTWDSAKADVVSAWDRLTADYDRARAK